MSASFSTATAAMRVNKDFPTHLKAYEMGAQKFDVLMWCSDLGIPAVTLWVCSTENLKRSDAEISMILRAVETKIGALAQDPWIHQRRVRVKAAGRLGLLPLSTVAIRSAQEATADYNAMTLTNYRSGLWWARGDRRCGLLSDPRQSARGSNASRTRGHRKICSKSYAKDRPGTVPTIAVGCQLTAVSLIFAFFAIFWTVLELTSPTCLATMLALGLA